MLACTTLYMSSALTIPRHMNAKISWSELTVSWFSSGWIILMMRFASGFDLWYAYMIFSSLMLTRISWYGSFQSKYTELSLAG